MYDVSDYAGRAPVVHPNPDTNKEGKIKDKMSTVEFVGMVRKTHLKLQMSQEMQNGTKHCYVKQMQR